MRNDRYRCLSKRLRRLQVQYQNSLIGHCCRVGLITEDQASQLHPGEHPDPEMDKKMLPHIAATGHPEGADSYDELKGHLIGKYLKIRRVVQAQLDEISSMEAKPNAEDEVAETRTPEANDSPGTNSGGGRGNPGGTSSPLETAT